MLRLTKMSYRRSPRKRVAACDKCTVVSHLPPPSQPITECRTTQAMFVQLCFTGSTSLGNLHGVPMKDGECDWLWAQNRASNRQHFRQVTGHVRAAGHGEAQVTGQPCLSPCSTRNLRPSAVWCVVSITTFTCPNVTRLLLQHAHTTRLQRRCS